MMRTPIDLTNQRFGRLTAIRDVGSRRGFRLWLLKCDCGSEIERTSADVRHGKVSSCGCFQREMSSLRQTADLKGRVFGRLTAVDRAGVSKHHHVRWNCVCACGASAVVDGVSLSKGTTTSCGCVRREKTALLGKGRKKPNPVSRTKQYRSDLRARLRERPEVAAAERVSRMLAHALARINAVKSGSTFEMLGYTPAQLRSHLERQFRRGMDWANRGEWEIDHIIPISTARTVDDVIALNQLSNLRPLWKQENGEKRARRLHLV